MTYYDFSVCLDWNAIGMLETSMAVFAECLSVNTSVTYLDLRNNQISHDGACELADALKRNSTLLALGEYSIRTLHTMLSYKPLTDYSTDIYQIL